MARWTQAQVEKLAPDDRSVKAARGLARPGPWSDVGATDALVWGKCQGSGKTPYQVSVDLNGPAFKCTCPSRKFPCKHGLALLILWARSDVGNVADPADFAADWAARRASTAAKKATQRASVDPEAQAKRREKRLAKMDAGLADFEQWLLDLVRSGLAAARSQPPDFWERTAARLVDAQVPGLADRVRRTALAVGSSDRWLDYLLDELSRWYLATRGWLRRASLDDATVGDLRAYLGWGRPAAEVADSGTRLRGPWAVVGVSEEDTGRILAQRTWLHHADGTHAVILDFAAAGGSLGVANVVGSIIDGDAIAYPGSEPARVMLAEGGVATATTGALDGAASIDDNLDRVAGWLAANPLAATLPMTLAAVVPRVTAHRVTLVDDDGREIAIHPAFTPWGLVVHCAAGPVDVFGEWDGTHLKPLSVAAGDRLVTL